MKKSIYFIILLLLLSLTSCNKKPNEKKVNITFAYDNGEIINEVSLENDKQIAYPDINEEIGYNYTWNATLDEINNATENLYVVCYKKEASKVTKYVIEDEVVYQASSKYFKEITEPTVPSQYSNYSWIKSEEKVDDVYYITYNLTFDYTTYNICYYDGDTQLELYPNKYTYGQTLTLPVLKQDEKEFVGWFVSDISMYRYTEISGTTKHDIKLYARFVDLSTSLNYDLGEYKYLITELKSTPMSGYSNAKTYNPVIPNGAPQGATNYEWSSLTPSIVQISQYSSITARKIGYGIIQGINKNDPSIILKGIVKITAEGIEMATLEETNNIEFCKVTFVDDENNVIDEQKVVKGGSVIAPIPPIYEGKAFVGWSDKLYDIKTDTTIKAIYKDGSNDYVGKKIAILGDSISTYYGLVPDGYAVFYPYPTANIFDYHDTWWMKTIDRLGAGLFIDNAYSGSCVATSATSSTTNDERLSQFVINGEKPDVIIIYMGSNDIHSSSISSEDFKKAYDTMLSKISKLCPDTEIIVCTLPTSKFYSKDNQTIYNNIIKECAKKYQTKIVDLSDVDISNYLVDSAHPQKEGMQLISDKIVQELVK